MEAVATAAPVETGRFVWYELITTDPQAAQSFYGRVLGWQARDGGPPGMAYTLLSAGGTDVAGLMRMPAEACEAGARPGWVGYVTVADVDAQVARIELAGGTTHVAPQDIPDVGRFAMVSDPQGAVFALFRPDGPPAGDVPAADTPGHAGWRELHANDGDAAFEFYAAQFGWTRADSLDMGPMGTYQLFAAGAQPIGGMMNRTADHSSPFWLYYFNVDGLAAAIERVEAGGGQVLHGPHDVPGGGRVAQCSDPQGAMFALVSMTP